MTNRRVCEKRIIFLHALYIQAIRPTQALAGNGQTGFYFLRFHIPITLGFLPTMFSLYRLMAANGKFYPLFNLIGIRGQL
jgi:hypothetical protein